MNFRVRRRKEPQLVIVSLIDVVLQLVIFLLLTTTFKAAEGKVDLSLPEADAPVKVSGGGVVVELDREGNLRVNGRAASRADLEDAFRREAEGDGDRRVLIRADRRSMHGDVVAILDRARHYDLNKISVSVFPAARGGPSESWMSQGRSAGERALQGS